MQTPVADKHENENTIKDKTSQVQCAFFAFLKQLGKTIVCTLAAVSNGMLLKLEFSIVGFVRKSIHG